MTLDKEQIQHIANLARLDLNDSEIEKYGQQLSGILSFIDQLKEVDTDDTQPTAQVTGMENIFREDEVVDWNRKEVEGALALAPELEGEMIKVKRIIQ